jgi:Tfp pilus assembly protein PilO
MRGRTQIILTVVGVVIVWLLTYLLLVNPQRSELSEVNAQIEAERTRTSQLRAELQRLQDLQANAPELQAELEEIRRFVPLRPELANFIFQVDNAAKAAGLDFVQITPELPEPPPEGATLAQVRATIGATGGYFALQDFLRRLYNLDRALRADTMNVVVSSLEPFGTRLGMTIAARIFYELPEPAPVAPLPGATPAPTPTPTPIP